MLTDDRIDAIFKEMEGYVIELIPDPTSLGPQYFRDLIATCRNYLNRVSLVLSELDRERLSVTSELRKEEALYELDYDDLLATNPQVRAMVAAEDRKATANNLLRTQKIKINGLKELKQRLDSVHKVVTYRNKELHATMAAIKDQKGLMKSEIRSGTFYGDERPNDRDEISAEELSNLIELDSVSLDEDTTASAAADTETAEEVSAFLKAEEAPAPHKETTKKVAPKAAPEPEEDDFTSLLEGL